MSQYKNKIGVDIFYGKNKNCYNRDRDCIPDRNW